MSTVSEPPAHELRKVWESRTRFPLEHFHCAQRIYYAHAVCGGALREDSDTIGRASY